MVSFDDEALQAVLAQESWRAVHGRCGQACLVDRAWEQEDLQQELLLHGYQLWQRFDWGRYGSQDDGLRAFRRYVRLSFWRRLGRIARSKVRAALPLLVEVEIEQEELW